MVRGTAQQVRQQRSARGAEVRARAAEESDESNAGTEFRQCLDINKASDTFVDRASASERQRAPLFVLYYYRVSKTLDS